MSACARTGPGKHDCRPVAREHQDGCTCTLACPPHVDHCGGCRPRDAVNGRFCRVCSGRFRGFLGAEEGASAGGKEVHGLPWAYDHLTSAYPSLRSTTSVPAVKMVGGIKDPEAERLAAVLTVRNEMADWLGAVTADLAERANLRGPEGLRLTTDYRERHVGRQRVIVRSCAAWLLTHIESLESGQGMGDAAGEAVAALWQQAGWHLSAAHALAPWRPAPTRIQGVPCWCEALTLDDYGDVVTCRTCGRSYTPEGYARLTSVAAAYYGRTA